jgi:hypothetical protein
MSSVASSSIMTPETMISTAILLNSSFVDNSTASSSSAAHVVRSQHQSLLRFMIEMIGSLDSDLLAVRLQARMTFQNYENRFYVLRDVSRLGSSRSKTKDEDVTFLLQR